MPRTRSHRRILLLYATASALWIVLTSLAVPELMGEPIELAWPEVMKGLFYVGASTAFLTALLGPEPRPEPTPSARVQAARGSSMARPAALVVGLVVVVVALELWFSEGRHVGGAIALGGVVALTGGLALALWRARAAVLAQARETAESARALAERDSASWEGLVLQLPVIGVAVLDLASGRVIYANDRFCELTGRPRAEVIGGTWAELTLTAHLDAVGEGVAALLAGTGPVRMDLCVDRGGRALWLDAELRLRRAADGTPRHIIGFLRDASPEREAIAEQRLRAEQHHASLLSTIGALQRVVELRDPYTSGHQRRVGELAAEVGRRMGFEAHAIEGLRLAGYVHDVGKITVPASILVKPGQLTPPELAIVKLHAEQGAEILRGLQFPWPLAEIVWQHHEHLDGTGYPRGLAGEQLLVEAQIVGAASRLMSTLAHRPHRPAVPFEEALRQLEVTRGRHYPGPIVDACVAAVREAPELYLPQH